MQKYNLWLNDGYFDEATKAELRGISDNRKEIEERFYKDLEFGTGGLRGIIGAGTNRMNIYTVRKASQGLANYVVSLGREALARGIVIAYDSRRFSPEFALEAAKVFCANGIKTYLFDELRPTPELSFAVRYLKAVAGIVVTASHNPKQYNGYKVYGEDGAQLSVDGSDRILAEIDKIASYSLVKVIDKEEAINRDLLEYIGMKIDDEYMNCLKTLVLNPDVISQNGDIRVVYTPLHGTGNIPVRRILKDVGFKNVFVVPEQEMPDSEFSTINYPNPEDKDAFKLAIELAKTKEADLIIGTDPDADRMGILVRLPSGEFEVLTGNQTGCLMLEYILSTLNAAGKLPSNSFVVKTVVTTELARKISAHYGVELVEVLTGFKFIGEQILIKQEKGTGKYIFGFEESYGYLAGTFARDKDAVVSAMIVAEMAAFYKAQNMNLYDALQEIYKKYGYYREDISNFNVVGKDGLTKIQDTMTYFRNYKETKFGEFEVTAVRDYLESVRTQNDGGKEEAILLPQSNVLYYELPDNAWFCVRPSGTEPKLKIYYGCTSLSADGVAIEVGKLKSTISEMVSNLLS